MNLQPSRRDLNDSRGSMQLLFFVNSYRTLFQCLALCEDREKCIFFISDQLADHVKVIATLNSFRVVSLLDKQYPSKSKINRIKKTAKQIAIYNFFRAQKRKKNIKVFINGAISSWFRLKYVSLCGEICYLDDGYQHYFHEFLGIKNFFYRAKSNCLSNSILHKLFGFRLTYLHENVSSILYTNEFLARESACVAAASAEGKSYCAFDLIESVAELSWRNAFINALFPDYEQTSLVSVQGKKSVCLLTQPFFEDGYLSLEENLRVYSDFLSGFDAKDHIIFLKIHPREADDKYRELENKFALTVLTRRHPFELFEINKFHFDLGVTINSTSVYTSCFKERYFLNLPTLL